MKNFFKRHSEKLGKAYGKQVSHLTETTAESRKWAIFKLGLSFIGYLWEKAAEIGSEKLQKAFMESGQEWATFELKLKSK